jgi:hypothetical protein
MRLLRSSFLAALAAFLFSARPATADLPQFDLSGDSPCATGLPTAVDWYAGVQSMPADLKSGQRVALAVDLAASPSFSADDSGVLRYRMAFNNVAEGWSWQPLARPEAEDYYRWKFFPLQSVREERPSYVQEEKIGEPQQTRVEWRYDYFLAFDNLYAFYPRVADDDAGFLIPVTAASTSIRLVALAVLAEPALSESTTFWKAIHARPVDFTLKKRYLIGALEALVVCDGASGRALARIHPHNSLAK